MAYTTAAGNDRIYRAYPSAKRRENHYELRYISKRDGQEKACYPIGDAKKQEQLRIAKEREIKVISCRKLYPINMEKNQHNFELVANIAAIRMHDMETGEIEWDGAEYDRLSETREKAQEFFGRYGEHNSIITWFAWEDYRLAKEMIAGAVNHRMDACERAGIPYIE